MKISSVTLRGFRCFAGRPTTIRLSDGITTLIGANGSGKTAFLEALTRVFGVTRDQRTVRRNDFYVAPEEVSEAKSSQELSIDVYLSFPELTEDVESDYFEEIIRRFNVTFRPTETGGEREFEALSDGQKSLFYFSLTSAVFDIERELVEAKHRNGAASSLAPEGTREGDTADKTEGTPNEDKTAHIHKGFQSELRQTPALTVFAIEEPENHLAPYFLARIVNQIRSIVKTPSGQAVIASHSPAILGRIDPSEVRHFRLDQQSRTAIT